MTFNGGDYNQGTIFYYQLPVLPQAVVPVATGNTSSEEGIQISQLSVPGGGSGVFEAIRDSDTLHQKVFVITAPYTFNFDAYFYSHIIKPLSLLYPDNVIPLGVRTPKKGNSYLMGGEQGILKTVIKGRTYWQVGNIMESWYKSYPPKDSDKEAAKIIPEVQDKPSIIALSYTDLDLIKPGQVNKYYSASSFKLAHSVDGVNWKLLPNSVVDTVNKTVAAITKVGGYYMIVGR